MFGVNMGMLFRICAILIAFDKFTESQFIGHLEKVRCRRIIDVDLKKKNMVLNGSYVDGNSVRFKCNVGLMSNVPNLQDILFECKMQTELGRIEWKGQGVGVVTKEKRTSLYLNNITCVSGCSRYDYSEFPKNMGVKSTRTTKLNVVNRADEPFDRNTYFLPGDTIALECKDGFIHEGEAEQSPENDQADYPDYPTNEGLEIELTTSLQCGENGKWNDGTEANFGICRAITCDAQSYQKIRDGVITNYKDFYNYSELLTLQCDQGFRPVNNRNNIQCLTDKSFEIKDFKCEAITCLTPPEPLHGTLETTMMFYLPNATAEFKCDHGYTMVGSPVWECQPDGEWNESCIQCVREDDYCQPPCVPFGARIVDVPKRIEIGTTIEFGCNDKVYGGSTNRTCLFNTQWSNEPIDCTGTSLFTPNTGINLKEALKVSLNNAVVNANESLNSENKDAHIAQGRTIKVNNEHGVDAYILIDVSKSIDNQELDVMKKFIIALVKNLGVSQDPDGTRVAVYLFATAMKALCAQYPEPYNTDTNTEETIIATINSIDNKTLSDFQKEKGLGTAISAVLDEVRIDIHTKQRKERARAAQQVVILVSDGKYTQRGSPIPIATQLKDKFNVELFSIFVGSKEDTNAYHVMKEMASKIEGEQHFFAIDIKNTASDMVTIINDMIEEVPAVFCGVTQPILTNTKNDNQSSDALTEKYAWPWMAQFRSDRESKCGGSLINNRWILTAAHCFFPEQCNDPIKTVVLKKWKTNTGDENTITHIVQYDCAHSKEKQNGDVFIHEKYKGPQIKNTKTDYTYDIALVRLPSNVSFDNKLHSVCLWDNTTEDMKTIIYDSLFAYQKYGVVTGWGYIDSKKTQKDEMKQLQFPIQNFTTCINKWQNLSANNIFNEDFMFCAGGTSEQKVIDACQGDSGGPFVVEHPRIANKYIQIGIVSFGLAEKMDECREKPLRGYYTKLNKELLEWINSTVSKNPVAN